MTKALRTGHNQFNKTEWLLPCGIGLCKKDLDELLNLMTEEELIDLKDMILTEIKNRGGETESFLDTD